MEEGNLGKIKVEATPKLLSPKYSHDERWSRLRTGPSAYFYEE